MKNPVIKLFLVLAVAIATQSSCTKATEEEAVKEAPKERSNFHATLDEKDWDADRNYGLVINGRLHLYAFSQQDGSSIEIDLSGTALQTHEIKKGSATKMYYRTWDTYDSEVEEQYAGQLTITKHDIQNNLISGTFSVSLRSQYNGLVIKVKEGVFTDVAYFDSIPVEGTELLVGLYKSGLTSGVVSLIRNKYSDSLQVQMLAKTDWFMAYHGATLNATGDQYLFMEDGTETKLLNLNSGTTTASYMAPEERFTPEYIGSKAYALSVVGPSLAKIVEFNVNTGETIQIIDTISVRYDYNSACTDGTYLYYRTGTDSLFKVNPVTKKTKGYRAPSGIYMGLDFISPNKFYTVKHVTVDNVDHNYLEIWTITNDSLITATKVIELQITEMLYNSGRYNKTLQKYIFLNNSKIEEIDLEKTTSKLSSFTGQITGVTTR